MNLHLGVVADEISRDFREAVRVGKEVGLSRYEIRCLKSGRAPVCAAAELREVEKIASGEAVQITALSPGLFKYAANEKDFRREMREVFPRAVELAVRWGLPHLIIFGFQKPNASEENGDTISSDNPPPFVINCLREAADAAEKANLKLLIESEPVCWADTAQATANLINRAGSAALCVNYDPSNIAWMERRDPFGEFDSLAPFIRNVHVKNQRAAPRGSGKPSWIVPDKGVLDWTKHFAALQKIGYAGAVSLEPHLANITAETLRNCKTAVENLWRVASDKGNIAKNEKGIAGGD